MTECGLVVKQSRCHDLQFGALSPFNLVTRTAEMPVTFFRLAASAVSIVGCLILVSTFVDWVAGDLATRFFPDEEPTPGYLFAGLLLALPVPLHVIFVGLIVQKRWLSPSWARFAWVGVASSGVWLGISLLVRAL